MNRVKTFDATGVAPDGRLYAGDLNMIQDAAAALADLTQNLQVGSVAVGEAGLQISRYGAGEIQLSGALRTTGILRGLGGLFGGTFTTAQRDAIAAGSRPYGLVITNTTNNRLEWNSGTDAAPNWQPISPPIAAGSIGTTELADGAVTTVKLADGNVTGVKIANGTITATQIADNTITAAKLVGAIVPSRGAGSGTETLRALGTGAGQAAAGTHGAQHGNAGADKIPSVLGQADLTADVKYLHGDAGTVTLSDVLTLTGGAIPAGTTKSLLELLISSFGDTSSRGSISVRDSTNNNQMARIDFPLSNGGSEVDIAFLVGTPGALTETFRIAKTAGVTLNGMRLHRHPYANNRHIEAGKAGSNASVTFVDAYAVAPTVVQGFGAGFGPPSAITTTGFTATNDTTTEGWIAEGQD